MIQPIIRNLVAEKLDCPSKSIEVSLRDPLEIQSTNLYDVFVNDQHLIAKQFIKPRDIPQSPQNEWRGLSLLAPHNISPQPLLYAPEHHIVVYYFMLGEMWDRNAPTAQQLERLAELWWHIQSFPTKNMWKSRTMDYVEGKYRHLPIRWLNNYKAWAVQHHPQAKMVCGFVDGFLADLVELPKQIAALQTTICFGKSDPRFANIINRPDGTLGMVDWEDCGLLDPAMNLADLLLHPNQEDLLTFEEWHPFLDDYLPKISAIDPTFWQRFERFCNYLAISPG